jgi:hypothetical protein
MRYLICCSMPLGFHDAARRGAAHARKPHGVAREPRLLAFAALMPAASALPGHSRFVPRHMGSRRYRRARRRRGGRPPALIAQACKGNDFVERCINQINDLRGGAMRFTERGQNRSAGVIAAAILIWLG